MASVSHKRSNHKKSNHKKSNHNRTKQKVSELAESRYALFAKQAASIELKTKRSDRELKLREQPLQKFSASGDTFGSVFLWKADDGRPATIGTIGCLPINGVDFGFTELHWLLDEPLSGVVVGPNLFRNSGPQQVMNWLQSQFQPV